jgi:hypothetical protein
VIRYEITVENRGGAAGYARVKTSLPHAFFLDARR